MTEHISLQFLISYFSVDIHIYWQIFIFIFIFISIFRTSSLRNCKYILIRSCIPFIRSCVLLLIRSTVLIQGFIMVNSRLVDNIINDIKAAKTTCIRINVSPFPLASDNVILSVDSYCQVGCYHSLKYIESFPLVSLF